MALKPRYKRRIFWTIVSVIAAIGLAIVLIPPMISLNSLKPKIEQAITEQTGVSAKIGGDVHFSLLGRATIVAHDVTIPMGEINAAMFTVPFTSIFDFENAPLNGDIIIFGADLTIQTLALPDFNHDINIHNSKIKFMDKTYEIINGKMIGGQFSGIIRTGDHKYDIEFEQDEFFITNRNNKLRVSGQLYSDGSTRGQMSLETDDLNSWFGFSEPKIDRTIRLTTKFDWDGGRGLKFTDINADKFTGNIEIYPDGHKNVELKSNNMIYDFSFLAKPNNLFYRTNFDLDFYGNLKFGEKRFKHLKINAIATKNKLQITNIIADDIAITGGTIDENGAHDILITMPYDGVDAMCLFSGNNTKWKCSEYSYGDINGSLSVNGDEFEIFINSNKTMQERGLIMEHLGGLGTRGRVNFQFADAAGTIDYSPKTKTPTYTFAKNKNLKWFGIKLNFIPESMQSEIGDFTWERSGVKFVPKSGKWNMYLSDKYFLINGLNSKVWLSNIDLPFLNDGEYTISGMYNGDAISNLTIKIANHEFTGSANGNNITLKTSVLNLDSFTNQAFVDNYEEMEFLTNAPIMTPFAIPVNISLSANTLIYNGNEYNNFVYSLKPDTQTFSITDSARGNLLATIAKSGSEYQITAQLNRFVINGELLASNMPLNIRDTIITAEINMTTSGKIAHDIEYNLIGNMDLTFEDGYLIGLGIDDFYALSENLSTLNAEYALSDTLEYGETKIKTMRIVGEYSHNNFNTTAPITLQMHHTDAVGKMNITDGKMYADFELTMRGTAPTPAPINLSIMPDNTRTYSLSEIMKNFDPSFMRNFVKTHNKF